MLLVVAMTVCVQAGVELQCRCKTRPRAWTACMPVQTMNELANSLRRASVGRMSSQSEPRCDGGRITWGAARCQHREPCLLASIRMRRAGEAGNVACGAQYEGGDVRRHVRG